MHAHILTHIRMHTYAQHLCPYTHDMQTHILTHTHMHTHIPTHTHIHSPSARAGRPDAIISGVPPRLHGAPRGDGRDQTHDQTLAGLSYFGGQKVHFPRNLRVEIGHGGAAGPVDSRAQIRSVR